MQKIVTTVMYIVYCILICQTNIYGQEIRDQVEGNLIQFNDNGAWCWYQDERVVIDNLKGKMILGSVASQQGVGGSPREGDVEATIFDFPKRLHSRSTLLEGDLFGCDDHNMPAFLVRPDSNLLTVYAGHHDNYYSYYRIHENGEWGSQNQFDWRSIPGGCDFPSTYSNLYYLSDENRVYNFSRTDNRSPNMMISDDWGRTWSYGGLLTETDELIGYVNGYFKYISNGIDRIDFVATEHHPRDYNTSIYHGYIKNGQSFDSYGNLMDSDISDKTAPYPADFTPVFTANTIVNDDTMSRCWTIDLQIFADSTLATIFKARLNDDPDYPSDDPDHVLLYAHFDGLEWNSAYLGKAGKKLYDTEQDYTGLGALHPNDPNTIYISTTIDPCDESDLRVYEIFKGTTGDRGESWEWAAITENSDRDNLRPVVASWENGNTALLWYRGTYFTYSSYDAVIVGIIDVATEVINLKTYIDADNINTFFTDNTPILTTGPNGIAGAVDNIWHRRTGYGNGGSILTSAEIGGEDCPVLMTKQVVTQAENYDVWVNFWANPLYDWRIKAGLSINTMQVFRQMGCKQVESGAHNLPIKLEDHDNTYLYQAYLGRLQLEVADTIIIYVDDMSLATGTTEPLIGDSVRTWYDGFSYATLDFVSTIQTPQISQNPTAFMLEQNYPNPFNAVTTLTYSLDKKTSVCLKIYNLLGQEIATLVNTEMPGGIHQITWNAENIPSGVYLYQLSVGRTSINKKMILLK